ncbi:hypothetical protein CAEBREN_07048 [Caenorhabditis brenneri]|uniref:G-protein coupled receptors family 1 profile domain-containing protein n=1 Tax=Caenorhabditis brenneri TaxID=135651 RepID=G0NER6_CAEBE|nr:hypothetical protein CAEBREN_07048 [Caenorhabditis brenneri]
MSHCQEGFLLLLSSPESLKSICHVITFIEIPFHIFGIFCIVAKTPERMKNVKMSMLAMHFSIICLNLIMSFLLIPYMMVPALAGVPLGLLEDWDVPLAFQMYLAVTGPAVTGITIVAVFENRYFLVCNNFYWKKIRVPHIIFNYLSAFLCFLYPILHAPDQNYGIKETKKNFPCILKYADSNIPIDSVFIFTQEILINAVPMIFVIFLVIVQASVVIALIYRHFQAERFKLSENTTQMQKRFMKALLGLNNLCIIVLSLNGLISTTAMIILHPPYREWITGIFNKKSRRSSVACAVFVP